MIRSLIAFAAGVLLTLGVVAAQRFTREVPDSPLASPAASAAARAVRETMAPHIVDLLTGGIETKRAILDAHFYGPKIEEARRLYPVRETAGEIAGVYVETFEPIGGPSPGNERRVLINLHGGAFEVGARTEGRLESIPVAHVAGMRVVSVDYRQGPEHRFPVASEDVAAVYRALLADHAPSQIGIFGCSAGGMLTAQSLAWLDAHDLPQPGAAGIFCAGAGEFGAGDARVIGAAFGAAGGGSEIAYLADVDWRDPLVAPIHHPELLERFPADPGDNEHSRRRPQLGGRDPPAPPGGGHDRGPARLRGPAPLLLRRHRAARVARGLRAHGRVLRPAPGAVTN